MQRWREAWEGHSSTLSSSGGGEHSEQLDTNMWLTAGPVRLSLAAVAAAINTLFFFSLCKLPPADVGDVVWDFYFSFFHPKLAGATAEGRKSRGLPTLI